MLKKKEGQHLKKKRKKEKRSNIGPCPQVPVYTCKYLRCRKFDD